ncbi:M20 family peptidase [Sphingomonas ginkgonis]|uniref:M20 family peptidase n=1 Tax=Sphingomonas ginkgonis TaxID=2315330 RepID=A0A3R9WP11_9SPHN|nr:M20/M25/M40 family metallo-hydrolase [Sphingomonas ginkgonis]RST29978.1 M20 family peptidase [Sphingomonas ginkgonis]
MLRFLMPAALLAAAVPAHAALTAPERRMVQTVDAERERHIALLQKLVDQNSGSHNLAGVEAVGRMVRAELEPLGFQVRWIPLRETGRAGHLVATHPGRRGGKRLLLIGHLDTVFEPDSPFQKFVREGDRARGPGIEDDKGGDVVMIAALRAMQAAGTLKAANIEIVLTGDEEDTGKPVALARRDLIAAGKRADVALDFEGLAQENGQDMGSVARRSAGGWTLTVSARPAHSSGVFAPGVGSGAIYELARIVDTFRRELREDKLTYNVGLVGGGQTAALDEGQIRLAASGKTNITGATAVARGDLRAISQDQIDRTRAKMQAIVAQNLPGTRAVLSFDDDTYPPMPPTAGNLALLDRLNRVNGDMGLPAMGALDPLKRGAGDISWVAKDVDGLVGLGAASTGAHTDQETIDLPSISRQAKRAAILMSRLAAERR